MKLLIVESPNKVKTISQFLPKDFVVKASVGHITKIADSGLYNMGIDPANDFAVDWEADSSKKDIIKELKDLVKKADEVYLCSDPDREGEAISWHLKEQLSIPAKKLKRCTFHEITKKAVTESLAKPGKIDTHLVDAAISRAILDKCVGYRCSPIARRKVSCRSVGRCQSAAIKLIVEREKEIQAFDSKTYYEIYLPFVKDKVEYKAQYKGLDGKKNTPTINDKKDAEKIISDCKGKDFVVKSIDSKDRNVQSKLPFTTSTYQQEVSSKLGYSVKKAMDIAQALFSGINIGGQHIALTTYLRTDSTSMDSEFKEALKDYVKTTYGEAYLNKVEKKEKKAKNQQDGHECFRCVDLSMTPEKLASYINDQQMIKVYTLIYNRTLASVMSDAIITDTCFTILNGKHRFEYTEHAVKFDGFRKIYSYDEEELNRGIDLFVKEKIDAKELELLEKATQPPKRYSQTSLVKKLEDSGVGRPSTYASLITTILDPGRGYCEEQGKAIAPTEKGMLLIKFLDEAFPKLVDINYTSNMEDGLDQVAKGKKKKLDFLNEFYTDLEGQIKNTRSVVIEKPKAEEVPGRVCPNCGRTLVKRNGRYGVFLGCPGWKPNGKGCSHMEKL